MPNRAPANADCVLEDVPGVTGKVQTCCWSETSYGSSFEVRVCQHCDEDGTGCGETTRYGPTPPTFDPAAPLQGGVLEQQEPPTPPPSRPAAPPQGGVLEQLEQGEGAAPPFVPGFLELQQLQPPEEQGAAELPPPATEETQPAAVEEEQPVPVCQEGLVFNEDLGFCGPGDCPEGQVIDEETGLCVLEEPEAAEEDPAQSEPEEENQPSEESDSGDDNSNN